MRIGFLIPEFPGQTHSFFWREISNVTATGDHEALIISTRLPAQPVRHDWTDRATAVYLYPARPGHMARAALRLAAALPRLLAQPDTRALLGRKSGWAMLLMAFELSRICKAEGIRHLHVHSCANAALIAAFLNRINGMPYSLVLHGPIRDYGPNQDYKWDRTVFGFVITERLKDEILAMLPDLENRLSVVPMGVDTDVFSPSGAGRAEGPWRWFSCGRLNRVKGFDTLIAAAARLKKAGIRFEISIAGEDEQGGTGYRREVEKMILDAGLSDEIRLLGAVTQERVLAELKRADGFVLASLHEPLGVVYMEAMACGLPTIGTRAGGVEELIEDGVSGRLVPPGDGEALAGAMQEIMNGPALAARLGTGGRARIVSNFGATRSARALVEKLGF